MKNQANIAAGPQHADDVGGRDVAQLEQAQRHERVRARAPR